MSARGAYITVGRFGGIGFMLMIKNCLKFPKDWVECPDIKRLMELMSSRV